MNEKTSGRFRERVQRASTFLVPILKHAKRHRVPFRLYSNSILAARPRLAGVIGRDRDIAWIPTGAPLGRRTYSRTMARILLDSPGHCCDTTS